MFKQKIIINISSLVNFFVLLITFKIEKRD